MKKSKKIFVLVGEESGDIIASDLIHEMKIQNRDKFNLKFYGVTGPRMKSYGVSTIFDFTEINFLGVSEIISNFFSLKIKLNKLIKNKARLICHVFLKFNCFLLIKTFAASSPDHQIIKYENINFWWH